MWLRWPSASTQQAWGKSRLPPSVCVQSLDKACPWQVLSVRIGGRCCGAARRERLGRAKSTVVLRGARPAQVVWLRCCIAETSTSHTHGADSMVLRAVSSFCLRARAPDPSGCDSHLMQFSAARHSYEDTRSEGGRGLLVILATTGSERVVVRRQFQLSFRSYIYLCRMHSLAAWGTCMTHVFLDDEKGRRKVFISPLLMYGRMK